MRFRTAGYGGHSKPTDLFLTSTFCCQEVRTFALQPDILHAVESRLLAGQPLGGANRAMSEGIAAVGAVDEFEALADAAENYRMLADDVAGAD